MDKVSNYFRHARKAHNRWVAMVLCLSMLVTIGTFAAFHKDAIAKTYTRKELFCPYAEEGAEMVAHEHNTDCYCENVLVCMLEEVEEHNHTNACFSERTVLCCELEETRGHVHDDACMEEHRTLVCKETVGEGHYHTEGCYALERGELICSIAENSHEHTDECFALNQVLVCDQEEGEGAHRHNDNCYALEMQLSCGAAEGEGAHTHSEDCYTTAHVLACTEDELITHQHGPECFRIIEINDDEQERKEEDTENAATIREETNKCKVEHKTDLEETEEEIDEETALPVCPQSDPFADLETAEKWERSFGDLELSGIWAEDLVMIAKSQLGYSESSRNFDAVLNENREQYEMKGWTRYGEWFGYPYGDWCAMFVSFCLHYAGISEEDFPYDCGTITWVNSLKDLGMYAGAENYEPSPGDLVFFDREGDGLADHVGIVSEADPDSNCLCTIEGNRTATVETFEYTLDDWHIMGYGVMPENSESDADYEEADDDHDNTVISEEYSNEKPKLEESTGTDLGSELLEVDMPAQSWVLTVGGIRVSAEAPEHAFPANTKMSAAPVNGNMLKPAVANIVRGEVLEVQAVDITFVTSGGEVVEPILPIRVTMTPWASPHEEQTTKIVHIDKSGDAELVEREDDVAAASERDVTFNADAFSIYAVVYIVEFEYESGGELYQFSLPGDGSIALSELAEKLGFVGNANGEDRTRFESREEFINEVENVTFSDESLLSVTRVECDTAEARPDLTDETVCDESFEVSNPVSDWVLIPLAPFSTEETLLIKMRNGDEISIRVTDDRESDAEELSAGDNITIILDAVWTDGTNTSPPEGAGAVFTVHQQRAESCSRSSSDNSTASECSDTEIETTDEEINEEQTPADSAALTGEQSESDDETIDEISILEYTDTDFVYTVSFPTENGSWSAEISDLITADVQGNRYRYYITEDNSYPPAADVIFKNENGIEISNQNTTEKHQSLPIESNQMITIENTYLLGSVRVTNHFIGINESQIPEDYMIIASWKEGETAKSLELTMEESLPEGVMREEDGLTNTWTIGQIPINTEVMFSEIGYEIPDHAVTINGNATPEPIVKRASAEPDSAVFSNEYDQDRLSIQKVWNGGAIPKEIYVELKRTTKEVHSIHVEITNTNNEVQKVINGAIADNGDVKITWTDSKKDWHNNSGNIPKTISVNDEPVQNKKYIDESGRFIWSAISSSCSLTIEHVHDNLSIVVQGGSKITSGKFAIEEDVDNNDYVVYNTIKLNSGNNWTVSWEMQENNGVYDDRSLPKQNKNGVEYNYYVLESPESYKGEDYTVSYNPPAGATSGLLQVINTGNDVADLGMSIRIKVQNDQGTSLPNAVFELMKQGSGSSFEKVTHNTMQCLDQNDQFTVSADGFTLSGLTDGVYRIEQIKEADGGVLTEKIPVKFTVYEGALTVNADDLRSATYQPRNLNELDSMDTFTIINRIGTVLPSTGGTGSTVYTWTGAVLFVLASSLLIRRRKKQALDLNLQAEQTQFKTLQFESIRFIL